MLSVRYQSPQFTVEDAVRLARDVYGLSAQARPLPSERDCNFHLLVEDPDHSRSLLQSAHGPTRREFVLKIANVTEERAILDLQNKTLEHLTTHAPLIALPRVRLSKKGETLTTVTSADGADHFMRLLTFVPGRLLAHTNPHTPEVLHSLGYVLGSIDCALQNFSHPAAQRELKWDLAHTGWIRDYLQHIPQPAQRDIVAHFLEQFEQQVAPVLPMLRHSIIYNDANDYNVLVSDGDPRQSKTIGVVDFGDMTHTATICELAITCAYAMLDKPDPLTAAAHVVQGYDEIWPLSETEIALLFPLICARLCITVTNAAYQRAVEPQNDYLTISERPAWDLLAKLAETPAQLAHYTFRQACALSPCPVTPHVVHWLNTHQDQIGHVIEPDLRNAPHLVFDLSIGSLELGNNSDFADTPTFSHKLFERMSAANVAVGIGRHNEARPIYSSDMFRIEGNEGPEWRTVHLGLDLFMQAGAAVFAPLDGIVHSFRNNSAWLDYGPTIILEHTLNVEQGAPYPLKFYTLYGHLSLDSLDGLSVGKPIQRGEQIAHIGDYPINGDWPPHLHFQLITDLLGREGEFPGVARPSQRDVWLSLSPDPNLIMQIPNADLSTEQITSEQIMMVRKHMLGPNLSISYQNPLQIVRGYRQYLYDEQGRRYLDAVNNVPHVGHSHPRVVAAGQRQMAVLNTNTRYLHDSLVRYAVRLCATLPEPLRVCYFVCSGSEANELALRLARTHTRQRDIIVLDVAYHGNTTHLIEISPYKHAGPGGAGAPPHVHTMPMPDVYRGQYKRDDPHAGKKYAQAVADALAHMQADGKNVAAFIAESVLSCGGQIVLPEDYLKAAYAHVRAAGGVCIADEVQTGFGRVGSHFWAFETQDVVPDIVTMGKPMGNGHPLAAVVTTPEIAASFDNGMEYFNTFGGNPVSCAIGMAVLDVIEEEKLQMNANAVGNHLLAGLRQLMSRHAIIGDVRGLGLFIGIEFVLDRETLAPAPEQASYIVNRMKAHGILLSTDGPYHNVIKIKPPLVFTKADADFLIATLDKVLGEDFVRLN